MSPEVIACDSCKASIHRDDWPSHQCAPLTAKPVLPVAGWLLRIEHGRLRILTLGALPLLGSVLVAATVLVEADFAREDEAGLVRYLLRELEGRE